MRWPIKCYKTCVLAVELKFMLVYPNRSLILDHLELKLDADITYEMKPVAILDQQEICWRTSQFILS